MFFKLQNTFKRQTNEVNGRAESNFYYHVSQCLLAWETFGDFLMVIFICFIQIYSKTNRQFEQLPTRMVVVHLCCLT